MRKRVFVPTITLTLSLLLSGCGGGGQTAASARDRARNMAGCIMEAQVSCDWEGEPWTALLRCAYLPGERSVVQALSPETIRGVQVTLEPERTAGANGIWSGNKTGTGNGVGNGNKTGTGTGNGNGVANSGGTGSKNGTGNKSGKGERMSLRYAGKYLDAGAVSREEIVPASCLPRLMDALRDGWLLEENYENWGDVPCARLALDQTGETGKIDAVLWLRREDGTPVRGELAVDGATVYTADFTSFVFYDTAEELRVLTGE